MRKVKWKYTEEELIQAVKESFSIAGVLRKLGLNIHGSNPATIKQRIKLLNLDNSHFTGQGHLKNKTHSWSKNTPLEEIFKKDSSFAISSNNGLKRKVIKHNLLPYECNICKISTWLDQPLVLQLDHISGDRTDNRLPENLRFLCPNCHSQTKTFCSKNKGNRENFVKLQKQDSSYREELSNIIEQKSPKVKRIKQLNFCNCGKQIQLKSLQCYKCMSLSYEKIVWPSKEELEKLVWEKSTLQLSKELGVSDKAVENKCKKYGIKKPERGYWAKIIK